MVWVSANSIRFRFQPTRPLRGATHSPVVRPPPYGISTHAPLAGRDIPRKSAGATRTYFNPRAPCGARLCIVPSLIRTMIFQPTRPLRGATPSPVWSGQHGVISTHAPLAGRDGVVFQFAALTHRFQPTRPLRGATSVCSTWRPLSWYFNPRAPCGARQSVVRALNRVERNFNPRAPCGARPRTRPAERRTV